MRFPNDDMPRSGDFSRRRRSLSPGEPLVRYHEQWLTRMLRGDERLPRIPRRRVDRGGYAALLAEPGGRDRAEGWWQVALDLVPL